MNVLMWMVDEIKVDHLYEGCKTGCEDRDGGNVQIPKSNEDTNKMPQANLVTLQDANGTMTSSLSHATSCRSAVASLQCQQTLLR